MMAKTELYAALLDSARRGVHLLDGHPIAGALIAGTLAKPAYAAYLTQVVHQVRASAPMLSHAGRRLAEDGRPRLAALFQTKAGEEDGHDAWALADLAVLGVPEAEALATPPCTAVLAYCEWTRHAMAATPAALLGVAFILEWFGYCRAGLAADRLVARNGIPHIARAVRFLRGHGDADVRHVQVLAESLAEVASPAEADSVVLSAEVTSTLYLGIFEWIAQAVLPLAAPAPSTNPASLRTVKTSLDSTPSPER